MVELMISITILVLIATATLFSLSSTRNTEELNTAARLLESDIRNIQARALAARDVLQCVAPDGLQSVCGSDAYATASCSGPCSASPPARFGIDIMRGAGFYDLFADVRGDDWRETNDREVMIRRQLNPLGGGNVVIIGIALPGVTPAPTTADIAVTRQSGVMRINACGDTGLPLCSPIEPKTLTITLRHNKSMQYKMVEVNAVTGRVSIQ